MILTRSGRSVNRPAKYVNPDVILLRPVSHRSQQTHESAPRNRNVMTNVDSECKSVVDVRQNLPVSKLHTDDEMSESEQMTENCASISKQTVDTSDNISESDQIHAAVPVIETMVESVQKVSPHFFIYASTAHERDRKETEPHIAERIRVVKKEDESEDHEQSLTVVHSMEVQNLIIQDSQSFTLEEQLALMNGEESGRLILGSSDEAAASAPPQQDFLPASHQENEGEKEEDEDGFRDMIAGHHVISIEEDGQITIQKLEEEEERGAFDDEDLDDEDEEEYRVQVSPLFPPWYNRLSTMMLGFLRTGWLVDVLLMCEDGEAIPAHQLILGHASPFLARMFSEAREGNQEEAVIVTVPGTDSQTLVAAVKALYSGILPGEEPLRGRVLSLFALFSVQLEEQRSHHIEQVTGYSHLQCHSSVVAEHQTELPPPNGAAAVSIEGPHTGTFRSEVDAPPSGHMEQVEVVGGYPCAEQEEARSDYSRQQVQVVQTDSGEILLVTCDPLLHEPDRLAAGEPSRLELGVERLKQIKMEQIREHQNRPCTHCSKPALSHRYHLGDQRLFVYRCCKPDCAQDSIKTARSFNQHMATHCYKAGIKYEPADRACPLCSKPRIDHKNRALSGEEKGNHRGNLYKCCHCSASKLSAKKFFTHLENHVSKKHVCKYCRKGYSYKHLLDDHVWKEHGEGQNVRFPCSWEGCDYSAKYKQTLHTHINEHHHGIRRKQRQDEGGKKIACPTCGKVLKMWYYLQFHKKTCTTGNLVYQCEICLKEGFINATTLQNHIRVKHSAERPFRCEYCPAKYATAMSLSGHRARKHGMNSRGELIPKKVFPCAQCGKLLTSGIKLRSHVEVVHEGQRNHNCTYCEKRFTSKSNLQIHEGSQHTGVLPYHCSFCDKTFARKSQLLQHSEQVHPGHAGQVYLVEDVDSAQIVPAEDLGDHVAREEMSIPIMESIQVSV